MSASRCELGSDSGPLQQDCNNIATNWRFRSSDTCIPFSSCTINQDW